MTASASNPCGRPLTSLFVDDRVELVVRGQVTGGINNTAGQQNGIMQFVHDVTISSGGVLQFVSMQPLGAFSKTRAAYESSQSVGGDLGAKRINGHTTAFSQGLSGAEDLYRVTFRAIAAGSVSLTIGAASEQKLAASTATGLKVGHIANFIANPPPAAPPPAADPSVVLRRIRIENGDPASVSYPSAIAITVRTTPLGDVNGDTARNLSDVPFFVGVLLGTDMDAGRIARSDLNCDGAANGLDVHSFADLLLP